jgi:site-specific DNA-methyltransferase (adenine-specific)
VTITPYYEDSFAAIYHGDALSVLAALDRPALVDAVITDPPYSSGTTESAKPGRDQMLRGQRFLDPIENDRMTTPGFVWLIREVALAVKQRLRLGASFVSFIDWRQWPTLVGALESVNLRVQAMVVWDKCSFGMGNGFRGQHELICHASNGVPNVGDRATPNVLRVPRDLTDSHPSPKPVELMRHLVRVCTPEGGMVLDPLMGAGSTLRAAKDEGRLSVGIEINERYCEIAARRLAQEVLDFGGAA